jgi:hypothetical protein
LPSAFPCNIGESAANPEVENNVATRRVLAREILPLNMKALRRIIIIPDKSDQERVLVKAIQCFIGAYSGVAPRVALLLFRNTLVTLQ